MICIIDLKRIVSLLPIAAGNLDFTGQHWLESQAASGRKYTQSERMAKQGQVCSLFRCLLQLALLEQPLVGLFHQFYSSLKLALQLDKKIGFPEQSERTRKRFNRPTILAPLWRRKRSKLSDQISLFLFSSPLRGCFLLCLALNLFLSFFPPSFLSPQLAALPLTNSMGNSWPNEPFWPLQIEAASTMQLQNFSHFEVSKLTGYLQKRSLNLNLETRSRLKSSAVSTLHASYKCLSISIYLALKFLATSSFFITAIAATTTTKVKQSQRDTYYDTKLQDSLTPNWLFGHLSCVEFILICANVQATPLSHPIMASTIQLSSPFLPFSNTSHSLRISMRLLNVLYAR